MALMLEVAIYVLIAVFNSKNVAWNIWQFLRISLQFQKPQR